MRLPPLVLPGVILALVLLTPAPAASAVASPLTPPRRAPASPRAVLAPPGYVARRVLPDSVLVRIDGREDVTRRRFARAVRLLGGNPDSLTPADRDRFLELVIEQRVLAARAVKNPQPWPRADSLQYLGERDNILIRSALSDEFSRLEAHRRALGQPDLDDVAMGIAARDSLMLELHPTYDEDLLKVVGSYFNELPQPTGTMSPREQMAVIRQAPKIPAADTLKILARSRLGEFTVADLLGDWRRLSSVYRPHVTDNEGVRALVQNSLFERMIREGAERPALERRPDVAAMIADRHEYHGVSLYLQREVIERMPMDSLTLKAYYRAHLADFDRPARAVLVLLTLDSEIAADSLARRFRNPGEAESLAFRAQRSGVIYTHVASATGDSTLYREAVRTGVGGVSGPVKLEGGWRVYRVLSIDPRSPQPYADVRPAVEQAWYEFESERRIRALLDELTHKARVVRNERALRALVLPRPRPRP